MDLHDMIGSFTHGVQKVNDVEKRREVLRFLPGLVESLDRLSRLLREIRPRLRLWEDVYGLPPLGEARLAWSTTNKLLEALGEPSAILVVPTTTISQLQNLAAETSTNWQLARTALDTALREHRANWEREVALLTGITEIPDLLDGDERNAVRFLVKDIRALLSLELSGRPTAGLQDCALDWREKAERFKVVKKQLSFEALGDRYKLRGESIALLQRLAQQEQVSLAQVSPEALTELQRFHRFCAAVTLHFSAHS